MKIPQVLFGMIVLCAMLNAAQNQGEQPAGNITAQQILAHVAQNNHRRQQELQSYTGRREYHLLYTGIGGRREATLIVDVNYQFPDHKDFTIVSETGSHWIVNHVFKKILDTEKEAADPRAQAGTALTEENYEVELLGKEDVDGRLAYILHVEPKTANRLLYRGKIWIDAADYALCKIDAEPAKRQSMWISKVVVHHNYRKIGDFWLPVKNESNTEVRLGGHAILSIDYRDYKVVAGKKSPDSRISAEQSPLKIGALPEDGLTFGKW